MAYDENSIKTLDWREHIRMRPGMYIGKLGDGASPDDGIYVLLKEVIDNSIDEFVMGFGKKITIDVTPDGLCEVRDFGRGIPLGKLLDCAAKINTGAKYDSDAFKKSVGLNGVGIKAVNALSDFFEIQAYRDGETTLFITEGISASGSITTARDAETQAVFSLRGKPLNSFGMSRKVVYENEEFNFLQHALNIENGLEELRYDKVVIATDADDDGMHIRILLMTFFIQFFPELIREGHLFILQTPLFRVRNKQQTIYCYSDAEREEAIGLLGKNPEITRFKGLGEISPQEFKAFIGEGMRLDRVRLEDSHKVKDLLSFYMGKNTRERQEYILNNLRVELDPVMD